MGFVIDRQYFKFVNGILLQLFTAMVGTLQMQDRNRKVAEQHQKKLHTILNNPSLHADSNKENKDHSQQKISTQMLNKKVEQITNSLRQTFIIYSRIHFISLTKFHTLFLAFHLYEFAIFELALKNIPQTYKTLCCMFIAMKYEQIYPIELKQLAKYMKIAYNRNEYSLYQLMILKAIGMNLNLPTINRTLQAYLEKQNFNKIEENTCFYLLELCFASSKIYKQFNYNDICEAVVKMAKIKQQKGENEVINKIVGLLLQCRINYKGLERHICHKYESKKYESVAHLPFKIQ